MTTFRLTTFFFLAACSKKVEELPPATQTGANTFGAKVNGEFWIPKSFGPLSNDILEARFFNNNDLRIRAANYSSSPTETEFEIFIKEVKTPGVYQLNSTVNFATMTAGYGYFVKRKFTPENEWITSVSSTGSVTISRVDTINKIVSGTFQFNGGSLYNAGEILPVTEGRFDLKIK